MTLLTSGLAVRAKRFASLLMMTALLLPAGLARADGTNTYKFTNKEGEKAHDLHIVFDRPVSWNVLDPTYGWQSPAGTFKACTGSGGKKVDMAEGAGGTGVDDNKSAEFTFGFGGDVIPQVLTWWWTKADGGKLGKTKSPATNNSDFQYASATRGGGLYLIISHGEQRMFQTIPGQTALQTAQRMAFEINQFMAFASAHVDTQRTVRLVFQGTAFGEPCDDYNIVVLAQDPAGPLVVSRQVSCAADLNGDGQIDFSDYLDFLNLYEGQDPSVDFNDDGQVDFSDYLEFLNLYGEGCEPPAPLCAG